MLPQEMILAMVVAPQQSMRMTSMLLQETSFPIIIVQPSMRITLMLQQNAYFTMCSMQQLV